MHINFKKRLNRINIYKNYKNGSGFTLIELLMVIVLISVLSGLILSVINVSGMRNRAKDAQRAGDLKRIQTALELYFTDHRSYPVNSGSFDKVSGITAVTNALVGTYVPSLPSDPRTGETKTATCGLSNYEYFYRTDAAGSRYVLMSFMEYPNSVGNNLCSGLANCSSGNVDGCSDTSGCGATCYGVENPL
jgi:prepilin-type N-terminal cleavage/methylation domain-containing protein